ncbi:unnamed protein product, partial [Brenthis ino]
MAQSEDTELTDLVVEALEKNGSLAKIRALLRANIFLAFEDDCENIKQNETLDKILLLPEGKLCLSIIHEFLNFCNLKNTLFVYKTETRQGREYTYDGENIIADKLNLKNDTEKEPLLLTLIKNVIKSNHRSIHIQNDKNSLKRQVRGKNYYSDDQNSTYIVNEDSSTTTSNSQSDNSSDEKNKLDLRLNLDNSDTDTSSGASMRGRNSSEYIINNHTKSNVNQNILHMKSNKQLGSRNANYTNKNNLTDNYSQDLKMFNNSSTDSTSYVELKPFNPVDAVLLNTTGLPIKEDKIDSKLVSPQTSISNSKLESLSVAETSNSNSENNISGSSHQNPSSKASIKNSKIDSVQLDAEVTEYSYDFTSPPVSAKKETLEKLTQSPRSIHEDLIMNKSNDSSNESHKHNSLNSQSSVSLSDVADLISERSSNKHSISSNQHKLSTSNKSNKNSNGDRYQAKNVSDDSGDFSDSPIPSLSNLSLDIHSD